MSALGVITGLASEAACLATFAGEGDFACRVAGANAGRAAEAAAALIAEGCAGLVSFGLAGGLDPGLRPGAVVLADRVLDPSGPGFDADPAWRAALAAALDGRLEVKVGALVAVGAGALTRRDKGFLHRSLGAAAVDMESFAVAAAAATAGVPFVVIRAIADPAEVAVPAWLPGVIEAGGGISRGRVLGGLAFRPWDVPRLVRLARHSRAAHDSLGRVAAILGGGFEFARG